jgi:hypothetical protein
VFQDDLETHVKKCQDRPKDLSDLPFYFPNINGCSLSTTSDGVDKADVAERVGSALKECIAKYFDDNGIPFSELQPESCKEFFHENEV